jgi:hypothetical protein
MNRAQKIINQLGDISSRPLENPRSLAVYISESFDKGTMITFYNWECPPRRISRSKDGKEFINYDVDLAVISKGRKIDQYTEIPRVIEKAQEEKEILEYLAATKINFRFVKVIADTNVLYIAPESMEYLGKKKIIRAHRNFAQLIADKTREYPVAVEVKLFTQLIKPFQEIYDNAYQQALTYLQNDSVELVTTRTYQAQLARTRHHVGLTNSKQVKAFTDRTIATYAAEGVVFDRLRQTDYFSNCVWLNIEEVNQRTIDMTNSLRKKSGLDNLPMIFCEIR